MSSKKSNQFQNLFNKFNNNVQLVNSSKIFAGLMIIILNISSKFVNIKLSKSIESYLKNTFSKQILVFAIAWMGTRDIYIALIITIIFIICVDYLFNEESKLCCLPESFTNYHLELLDENKVSEEDVKKATEILEKAKKQKENYKENFTKIIIATLKHYSKIYKEESIKRKIKKIIVLYGIQIEYIITLTSEEVKPHSKTTEHIEQIMLHIFAHLASMK
jgi:hypothetical protein